MESSTIAWVALLANNIASSLESAYPLSHVNSESVSTSGLMSLSYILR
jgi:hypothetical protein